MRLLTLALLLVISLATIEEA
jgi:hypothetical protein